MGDWAYFGTHTSPDEPDTPCEYAGQLVFTPEVEDGLPLYEKHIDDTQCRASVPVTDVQRAADDAYKSAHPIL